MGTILFWVIPGPLLRIFNASDAMLQIGIPALRIISLSFTGAAVGILLSTLFQAVGKGNYSLLMSALRQLIVILPLAYLLSKIGLQPVWIAFPVAELVSLAAGCGTVLRPVQKAPGASESAGPRTGLTGWACPARI